MGEQNLRIDDSLSRRCSSSDGEYIYDSNNTDSDSDID